MQELNAVIVNNFYDEKTVKSLFGDELVFWFDDKTDMYDLLVMLECFSSKSEARKNWTRTGKEITRGYNEFKNIGKQKKALHIWNPVGEKNEINKR